MGITRLSDKTETRRDEDFPSGLDLEKNRRDFTLIVYEDLLRFALLVDDIASRLQRNRSSSVDDDSKRDRKMRFFLLRFTFPSAQ